MSGDQGFRFRTWSDGLGAQQLRIGDVEREAAVTALGEHYASGRLTKEEYDDRSTVAYEARSLAALQPLFADLPLPHGPLEPASATYAAGPGAPKQGSRSFGPAAYVADAGSRGPCGSGRSANSGWSAARLRAS